MKMKSSNFFVNFWSSNSNRIIFLIGIFKLLWTFIKWFFCGILEDRFFGWINSMIDKLGLFTPEIKHSILSFLSSLPNVTSILIIIVFLIIGINSWIQTKKQKDVEKKLKEELIPDPRIGIFIGKDDNRENEIYKQIELISYADEIYKSCYAQVMNFYGTKERELKKIEITSNDLEWSRLNGRVTDNKLDLYSGIPAKLYIASVNIKNKQAQIIGMNNHHTQIDKGRYILQIMILGDNLTSRTCLISVDYDGNKTIKINKISENLSTLSSLSLTLKINPIDFLYAKLSTFFKWRIPLWLKRKQFKK